MFKYIWIIMLGCIDIVWIIVSVIEIIRAMNMMLKNKCYNIFDFFLEVEDYATGCIFAHLLLLFMSSLIMWLI